MSDYMTAVLDDGEALTGALDDGGGLSADIEKPETVYEKDYEGLINRPHINGVELIGNKSFEELGDQELTNMEILSLLKMAGF